jgi:curli biogenesis system outer membrane secretion channel CsgG
LRRGAAAPNAADAPLDVLLSNAKDARVNYVVLGSITQFSMENRQRAGGGILPHVPLGGFSRRTNRLAVTILARVVDVQTGEVVTTGSGTGVGARGNLSVGAVLARPFGLGGFRSGASDSRDAQLNEALTDAVDGVARSLANASPRLVAGRN